MEYSEKHREGKIKKRNLSASFINAFSGLIILLRSETNARIHLIILILVLIAGLILKLSLAHWIAVSLAAGLVITAECLNTAIEYLCDAVSPGYDLKIKKAKDLAAAGVLISAIVAAVTGLSIFLPAIINFINP